MIEVLSLESISSKPSLKKTIKHIAKSFEHGREDDLMKGINQFAEYIDDQPQGFRDDHNASDFLFRDSQENNMIKKELDKLNHDEIPHIDRVNFFSKKIEEINVYHSTILEYDAYLKILEKKLRITLGKKEMMNVSWSRQDDGI